MKRSAFWRLSVMMFLEYAIWGAWAPILYLHLAKLPDFTNPDNFFSTPTLITLVYMTMAIASMVSPLAGQIADRYFPTQYFLALSHLVGGVLLIWIAYLQSFGAIFLVMLCHCLVYAPTVGLTNSIALQHLPDSEKDFGRVRLWGTIGWIVIMWIFSLWLGLADGLIEFMNPEWKVALADWRRTLPEAPSVRDCLIVGGVLSIVLAGFSLFLPHTPPSKKAENPFAFLGAVKLMKQPSFAVLIVVAFLVSTELQFYYVLTPGFFNQSGGPFNSQEIASALAAEPRSMNPAERAAPVAVAEVTSFAACDARSLGCISAWWVQTQPRQLQAAALVDAGDTNGDQGLSRSELEQLKAPAAATVLTYYDQLQEEKGGLKLEQAWVGPVMTFGQIAEVFVLLLVPLSLRYLGFRYTIALGILAWSVRYFIFSIGQPWALVIASQSLHGFGFGFFFVGAFIYGDTIAARDIRASVQSFIIFISYGAGMVVSSLIAGPVAGAFQNNWHYVFLVPAIITAVCTLVFIIGFRDPAKQQQPIEAKDLEKTPAVE